MSDKMFKSFVKYFGNYIIFSTLFFPGFVVDSIKTCDPNCTLCEKDSRGDIVKVSCVDVVIPLLPDTVTELHVFNASHHLLPMGIIKDYFFIDKEDLRIVEIRNYGITMVWGSPFVNCTHLISLDFSDNKIISFMDNNLIGPTDLRILRLNNNKIRAILDNSFSSQSTINELYLSGNEISTLSNQSFSGMTSLSILDLSNNKVSHIQAGSFQSLSDLRIIHLQNNKILTVAEALFSGLSNLMEVYLQNNQISNIGATSIQNTNISVLDMSRNKLTSLSTDVFSAVSGNSASVDLSYNLIDKLLPGTLTGVEIQILNLKFNKIAEIQPEAFQNANIKELNLYHNLLQNLPSSMEIYFRLSAISRVILGENPWLCDCRMLWFAKYKAERSQNSINSVEDIMCQDPGVYSGRNLKDLFQSIAPGCLTSVMPQTVTTAMAHFSSTSATTPASKTTPTTATSRSTTDLISKTFSSVAPSMSASPIRLVSNFSTTGTPSSVSHSGSKSSSTVTSPALPANHLGSTILTSFSSTKISTTQMGKSPVSSAIHGNSEKSKSASSDDSDSEGGGTSGIIGGILGAIFVCGTAVAGIILFKRYKSFQSNKVRDVDYSDSEQTDHLEYDLNDASDKTILGPSKVNFNQSYFNNGKQILHEEL